MPKLPEHPIVTYLVIGLFSAFAAIIFWFLGDNLAEISGNEGTFLGLTFKAGGLIAGFVLIFMMSQRAVRQMRVTREEIELETLRGQYETQIRDLQAENVELQQKVIRGAPRPVDYTTEVDERQRIVLARPRGWRRGGGVIFEFQSHSPDADASDIFPANFRVSFNPLAPEALGRDEYYANLRAQLTPAAGPFRTEFVHVGGDPAPVPSLKILLQTYALVREVPDPVTGRIEMQSDYVDNQAFSSWIASIVDQAIERLKIQPSTASYALLKKASDRKIQIVNAAAAQFETAQLLSYKDLTTFVEDELKTSPIYEGRKQSEMKADQPAEAPTQSAARGAEEVVHSGQHYEVLPVGRILVVCYHTELETVYLFDMVDNAAEFTESSDKFNKIMNSVRFLV